MLDRRALVLALLGAAACTPTFAFDFAVTVPAELQDAHAADFPLVLFTQKDVDANGVAFAQGIVGWYTLCEPAGDDVVLVVPHGGDGQCAPPLFASARLERWLGLSDDGDAPCTDGPTPASHDDVLEDPDPLHQAFQPPESAVWSRPEDAACIDGHYRLEMTLPVE